MLCDICSSHMDDLSHGFVLTTSQVVYSSKYWKSWFKKTDALGVASGQVPLEFDPQSVLPYSVEVLACHETNWAVCPNCIGLFKIDRNEAKRWAKRASATGEDPQIPGMGRADVDKAMKAAMAAWFTLFGAIPIVESPRK